MSFEMQTTAEILARLQADLVATGNAQSTVEGTFNADMLTANSKEFELSYAEMKLIIEAAFADTSWGEYLTMRAAEHGVVRKSATASQATLKISGTAGSSIISGSLFTTAEDLKFYTTAAAIIDATGSTTVLAECNEAGATGNVDAGTITAIPYSIPGVTAVTNELAATEGYNEETDAELLARFLLKVRTPATSGNKNHYLEWALSIAGVGNAKVIPLAYGNGTVKVIIVNDANTTASDTLISKVKDYIETVRPIGATVTVTSPTELTINVTATVTGTVSADTVKAAITSYFKTNGFSLSEVSIAQIGKIILDNGATDYSNLKINDSSSNIAITVDQIPAIGTVTLNAA